VWTVRKSCVKKFSVKNTTCWKEQPLAQAIAGLLRRDMAQIRWTEDLIDFISDQLRGVRVVGCDRSLIITGLTIKPMKDLK